MFNISKIYKTSRNDVAINIRFPEDIYITYKNLSKQTGHSFNGLVISAMHYAIDNMDESSVHHEKLTV